MQVKVRLFATLRQLAGWGNQALELPEDTTVTAALAELDRRYPQLTVTTRTIYVAVNQEYARGTQVLREGDELALFPPVSGGSNGAPDRLPCAVAVQTSRDSRQDEP